MPPKGGAVHLIQCLFWWYKVLPGGSEGSQMGQRWVVYHPCLWTRSLEEWEMLQMGNFEFHFSSLCIKNEAEENAFVLVVKSVAQGVCGVPDGSQMGSILSLPLDEVAGSVGDVTDGKFQVSHL